ncbi:Asp23/Gls24 family envelope stress response protein [Streptomyces poriferorum]|uniref:Asp23/Gls24 family envelope stress response protein n=1 Tax=Streptomyces poriferorum TaxID=2798799 RepID=A0ABY9ILD5_9ACTN|nr:MULTISPECIES: Asp23/Gls24 family envelope stress response protein [Streptomyces]MBW5252381.1 Asp23/Gls24 family envelope stress response protein [Streptomyces poriferorum]MBW5259473.1 Asp23/Gls24 family envelope stress response protein [Streptomyces poriferorum]MDP5316704.1 Asp23/Gls24 family envelope stress response protein [Streptomyces sp. Alt4]WLQ52242.1 Asp23/Gls24 family envelope stress response protein [Streptomyces sp. Alt1]WLQ55003.1 Asp23/Gls24 family envelope stress response prot
MATNGSGNETALGSNESAGGTRGTTVIADSVVSTIAGIAVRETDGVHALGGGASRAMGAMKDKVSRSNDPGRGVKVEVGEKQAAVDVDIVVEYGTLILDTAKKIRMHVTDAVETMTGLEVVEINIKVLDVYVPGDDDGSDDDEEKSAPERSRRVQ